MAFGRKVSVLVGAKGSETKEISELKIEFEVAKTAETGTKTNNAKVKIYNCNGDTEAALCAAGNHLILKAGYEDEVVSTVIIGDIVKGERRRSGNDTYVEVEVSDGREAMMNGQVSLSYATETDVATVVQGFTDVLAFPVKGTDKIPSGEKYMHGYSFIGMATDGLTQALNRVGLTYTVQNEMLYIREPGEETEDSGLELSPESGLLTLPCHVSDKGNTAEITEETKNRWKFTAMLFPQLMPSATCKVKSSTLNSNIIIEQATFKGDNWDGEFVVEIIGVER